VRKIYAILGGIGQTASKQVQGGDSSQVWHWECHIWALSPVWGSQLKGGIHKLEGVEGRCVPGRESRAVRDRRPWRLHQLTRTWPQETCCICGVDPAGVGSDQRLPTQCLQPEFLCGIYTVICLILV